MSPDEATALGTAIRQRRELQSLSVRSVASRAGITHTSLMRIEAGRFATVAAERLRAIADALDMPALELLSKAGYVADADLPQPEVYLRVKYPDLPAAAVAEATHYLAWLMHEHGVQPAGPAPGEDENQQDH